MLKEFKQLLNLSEIKLEQVLIEKKKTNNILEELKKRIEENKKTLLELPLAFRGRMMDFAQLELGKQSIKNENNKIELEIQQTLLKLKNIEELLKKELMEKEKYSHLYKIEKEKEKEKILLEEQKNIDDYIISKYNN